MSEETQDGRRVRPPFLKHFIFIILAGAIALAATSETVPAAVGNRIAAFLGAALFPALIALLVYYVTWKGGVGSHPIRAGWGAAALTLFFMFLGR